jgi:hypothetical protein
MFRESDKVVEMRRESERNPIAWGHANWDPNIFEQVVEYRALVSVIKERLRVMGFTLSRTKAEWHECRDRHVTYLRELAQDNPSLFNAEIELLSESTFDDFLNSFREILSSGIHRIHIKERQPNESALTRYVLSEGEDFYWGFPCQDLRSFFRALLEVVPDSSFVSQELTDLVSGGYYEIDTPVTHVALEALKGDYSINSPIVVLTEGPTDTEVIRSSFEVLFPHLIGYYSFMDLAVKAPGGADSLVHVVKSFAGAGIENRVIAVFDNDAAGHSAANLLSKIRLPRTIHVLTCPSTALARSYPTDGPNGLVVQDINGAACSIELYFGRDILERSGQLVPVKWRGFNESVKRYQGEIQFKDSLKSAFLAKVNAARSDSTVLDQQDWSDMRLLLETIIDTFNITEHYT